MFQFGLFSTHLPYILTVVAYLLSFGYYAFNKPKEETTERGAATLSYSKAEVKAPVHHASYDASSHFHAQEAILTTKQQEHIVETSIQQQTFYPPSAEAKGSYRTYSLFSRPPTFC